MDFTLIEKREFGGACYKLLKSNFYRGYYIIIAQDKREFYCGSVRGARDEIGTLFDEISSTGTDVWCVRDVLCDFERQKV